MTGSTSRAIIKLLTRILPTKISFRIPKKGEGRRSYIGCLRFEDRCISEKCLAAEDTFEMINFLKRSLHDVFRGSCLPECDNVELSGYGACFHEARYITELLNGILD